MANKSARPILKVDDSDLPQLKPTVFKDVDDDQILAAADELTARHGALRSSVVATPKAAAKNEISPRVLMSLSLPAYLDTDLTLRAAQRRVSKLFLILEALAKSGYEIRQEDLIGDRRRKKR